MLVGQSTQLLVSVHKATDLSQSLELEVSRCHCGSYCLLDCCRLRVCDKRLLLLLHPRLHVCIAGRQQLW